MIAAAMANHRHVGGPSLAAQPYGVAAPFSVLMPPAAPMASLGGTFGRYRIRLAKDGNDRLAACRLRFNVFNVGMGEGLSSSYSTGLDRDRFDEVCDHLIVTAAAIRYHATDAAESEVTYWGRWSLFPICFVLSAFGTWRPDPL